MTTKRFATFNPEGVLNKIERNADECSKDIVSELVNLVIEADANESPPLDSEIISRTDDAVTRFLRDCTCTNEGRVSGPLSLRESTRRMRETIVPETLDSTYLRI